MQYKISDKLTLSVELFKSDSTSNSKPSDDHEDDDQKAIEEVAVQLRKIGDEVDKECNGLPKFPNISTGKLVWILSAIRSF